MTTERLTEKMKDSIGKVLNESVENYQKGKDRAAWTIIDSNEAGRILLVKWPNDDAIDVNWSPNSARYGDLGTMVGCIGTEYFNIDTAVFLLTSMVQSLIGE